MIRTFLFLLMVSGSVCSEDNFSQKNYKRPLREISIIATDEGYYPKKMMAFKGERIRIFVTGTGEKSSCLLLQKHELFLSADKGKISEGEILADAPGRFKYYCPSHKHEGYLTIYEKFKEKSPKKRDIASEKPNYWTPRNYD